MTDAGDAIMGDSGEPSSGVGGMTPSTLPPSVAFSSKTDEWSTPQSTFDQLAAEFGPFDLDVCASAANAKCARFYSREDDGLAQPWDALRIWMNPPYGAAIRSWMERAYLEGNAGKRVVCLVPARTDTRWWHDYAAKGSVRFLRGRLKFGGSRNSAPFPSAVVVFDSLPVPTP